MIESSAGRNNMVINKMLVKICGITNRDDAMAAVDAGATALGFIFYPKSPRHATAPMLAPWLHEIPPQVLKVGVFVDEAPETIEALASQIGLNVAQLHGSETPDRHPRNLTIWKGMRVRDGIVPAPDYPADAILLDGPGNGQTFNWALARQIQRHLVLAGGLTPENVRQAIDTTNPYGVDIASGIESIPGRKDHTRMKQFIKAALSS